MRLFGTTSSPYVRKVRVVIYELGLEHQVAFCHLHPLTQATETQSINPLGKIPALEVAAGAVLVDSPLICEYLCSLVLQSTILPAGGMDRFAVLTLQALADGIMDAAVQLTMEKRRDPQEQRADVLSRNKGTILRTLALLEGIEESQLLCTPYHESINLGSLALACALDYLEFRHPNLSVLAQFPSLNAWLSDIHCRPALVTTRFQDPAGSLKAT